MWLTILDLLLLASSCIFISPSLLVLLIRRGIAAQIPRVVHHKREVIVVVDAHRDVLVILNELVQVDAPIALDSFTDVVMCLECLKELDEYLLFASLAINYIGMLRCVVRIFDVLDVKVAGSVLVDLCKCLFDKFKSHIAQLASYGHQELVNVQSSIMVRIKGREQSWNVLLRDTCLEVAARLCKLLLRQCFRAIIIHYFK